MRLDRILVRDFRALRRVELAPLPAEGIIAIVGGNESGKSALGEAITFAFYGRGLDDGVSIVDLIRWGEDGLDVEIEFTAGGRRFVLHRALNRLGMHSVTLRPCGGGGPCHAGVDGVAQALRRLGLADFGTFRRLLFLTRPLVDPVQKQALLADVTGMHWLERAAQSVGGEVAGREREYSLLVKEIERKTALLERMRVEESDLDDARARAEELRGVFLAAQERAAQARDAVSEARGVVERMERHVRHLAQLDATDHRALRDALDGISPPEAGGGHAAEVRAPADFGTAAAGDAQALRAFLAQYGRAIEEAHARMARQNEALAARESALAALEEEIGRLRRSRTVSALAALLGGVIAAGAAVGALVLSRKGVQPEALHPSHVVWIWAGAGLALLWAAAALCGGVARSVALARRRREHAAGTDMKTAGQKAAAALEEALTDARDLRAWPAVRGTLGGEHTFTLDAPWDAVMALVRGMERDVAGVREALSRAEAEDRKAQEKLKRARAQRDRAENDLRERLAAEKKCRDLETEVARVRGSASRVQEAVEAHLLARELLDEARSTVKLRAVPVLGRMLRDVIVFFTGGAYRDVRIGETLDVELFAPDKGDFLAPTELSGATQAGLGLGLAVALAALMARTRTTEGHYLYFDDPVDRFDAARLEDLVRGLHAFPALRQVFVCLKEVPCDVPVAAAWRLEAGMSQEAGRGGAVVEPPETAPQACAPPESVDPAHLDGCCGLLDPADAALEPDEDSAAGADVACGAAGGDDGRAAGAAESGEDDGGGYGEADGEDEGGEDEDAGGAGEAVDGFQEREGREALSANGPPPGDMPEIEAWSVETEAIETSERSCVNGAHDLPGVDAVSCADGALPAALDDEEAPPDPPAYEDIAPWEQAENPAAIEPLDLPVAGDGAAPLSCADGGAFAGGGGGAHPGVSGETSPASHGETPVAACGETPPEACGETRPEACGETRPEACGDAPSASSGEASSEASVREARALLGEPGSFPENGQDGGHAS